MNNFSDTICKSPLIGAELVQVCVGRNEIILHFYPDGISITILSVDNFLYTNSSWFEKIFAADGRQSPFGKKIDRFVVVNQATAYALLSNGNRIVFEDDNPALEAVVFKFPNGTYVV